MSEEHQPRGRRQVLGTAVMVVGLCLLALALPDDWLSRIGDLFGTRQLDTDAFSARVVAADDAMTDGAGAPEELQPFILARRLTRAGPMTREEVDRAAELWRQIADDPRAAQRLVEEFPRLNPEQVVLEIQKFRGELVPPGSGPVEACATCHSQTLELPGASTYDVAGIYPRGAEIAAFAGGRRVPLLSEAIELDAARNEAKTCLDCHVAHDEPSFDVDRAERISNMGLWVTTEPADPNILHVRVKVQNVGSGHLAPGGRVAPAYVVVAEARQSRRPLELRYGPRLPAQLRERGVAGEVFARDFRDRHGRPTSAPSQIVTMRADTRLESGRFAQLDFVFDRIDRSKAHLEVTLWHLPDVTTWKGARAIRRADKPEE